MVMLHRAFVLLFMSLMALHASCASPVYEISKGGKKLYLAGTIHLLRQSDFPLPKEFDAAYKSAQKIYFETDLQQVKSDEFRQRFTQSMLLPSHQTLKDVLSPSTWKQLQDYARTNQYPLDQSMTFNAAMTSILITLAESKKLGIGEGVDAYYDQLARRDNKMIGGLESGEDVIAYMTALNQEDPNALISNSLTDVKELQTIINNMIKEWRAGDLDALDKDMAAKMRNTIPRGYNSLVIERNQKWLPQIESMLSTPEVEMVLVGSMHLSGKDGLLALLRMDGFKVVKYQPK